MAFMQLLVLVSALTVVSTMQTSGQYEQPVPHPCSTGAACRHTYSRSFVNNDVYCCLSGGGLSVSSFNNFVHCQCSAGHGGGYFFSDASNTFVVNGQPLNETQVQPMLDSMRQTMNENMQQFQTNLQNQMAAVRQRMSDLRMRLNNMYEQNMQRFQAQMANIGQWMGNLGQGFGNMFGW